MNEFQKKFAIFATTRYEEIVLGYTPVDAHLRPCLPVQSVGNLGGSFDSHKIKAFYGISRLHPTISPALCEDLTTGT